MSKSIYLHDIPLAKAQQRLEDALRSANRWGILGVEEIILDENAIGRFLAEAVFARISSPHYHAAAMDGFAVHHRSTEGAQPNSPVTMRYQPEIGGVQYVDTGDPLPEWANAVIPIENVEPLDEQGRPTAELRSPKAIRIRAAITPWSHVRPLGEDMVATQLVLPGGHRLRPVDLGALAGSGNATVRVVRKPHVAVLPTGTELVPVGTRVNRGDIIEYNSLVLAAQVNSWGGEAERYSITPDIFDLICQRVQEAADHSDLVVLNAGSSAGAEDFSARVVQTLGTLLVHGVAVRPGHPVILGLLRRSPAAKEAGEIPIIGVPGYPVSAALTGEIFVAPLIARWLGQPEADPAIVQATLTRKITSPAGDVDYMRVAVGRVGSRMLAAPLSRGAGVISSLVHADGIAILPAGVQGMAAGDTVAVRLYTPPADLEKTIFAIGSHDISLDLMAQFLAEGNRRLSSANVGSQGGLVALRRGEAHLAGSHLLDPQTGEYNIAYIRQYLPGIPVRLITLVNRQQGFMVRRGNPKRIHSLADLAREDVMFINRQRGAGTRVLLDYELGRQGIAAEQIAGYTQEEFTHLAVAAAIASGRADVGLGIAAAAQALELDFIPLFDERYDLVIPQEHYESSLLVPLLDLLQDEKYRQAVAGMPGYDITLMGQEVSVPGSVGDSDNAATKIE